MPYDPNDPNQDSQTDVSQQMDGARKAFNDLLQTIQNDPDVRAALQSGGADAATRVMRQKYAQNAGQSLSINPDGTVKVPEPSDKMAWMMIAAVVGLPFAVAGAAALAGAGGVAAGAGAGADTLGDAWGAAAGLGSMGGGAATAATAAGVAGTGAATAAGLGTAGTGAAGGAGTGLSWGTALRYGAPLVAGAVDSYMGQQNNEANRAEQSRQFNATLAERQRESNQSTSLSESQLDPYRSMMFQTQDAGRLERAQQGPNVYRPSLSGAYNPSNEPPPLSPSYRTMLANAQRRIITGSANGRNPSALDASAWGNPTTSDLSIP